MGLREQIASDNKAILGDTDGFAWPITVTDPAGTSASLTGISNDVHQGIDPNTGQFVTGREASVVISISALADAGLGVPKGIASESSKPWVVSFDDVNGATHTFKVQESRPDASMNHVLCNLELYKPL